MALRGRKPEDIQERLKFFVYGPAKVGKTTLACQFPKPYIIDTERGAENDKCKELLTNNGECLFHTLDYDEMYKEILALMTEKHPFKTLVIDSITWIYDALVLKYQKDLQRKNPSSKSFYGRDRELANHRMRELMWLLLRLDMNVVITSHLKKERDDNMNIIGNTFDTWKKLEHVFDLIIEIGFKGNRRVATIKGSRLKNFPMGEDMECSYEEFKKRHPEDILEKSTASIALITPSQLAHLKALINQLKVPVEVVEKWLLHAETASLAELDEAIAQKIIVSLESKTNA